MKELELELSRDLDSAAEARHAIDELQALPDDHLGDVRLLVSELVTNSLRHAQANPDDKIVLVVDVEPDRTRVEVADTGGGFSFPGKATDPETVEGWGLYLVATLADDWGVDPEGGRGATVWFELGESPAVASG